MSLVHDSTRKGCPGRRCDRPRQFRLISAAARRREPRGQRQSQLVTEQRAIGPSKRAEHKQQDKHAKNGRNRIDRFSTPRAPSPARVAEGKKGGRKSKSSHYL